MKDISISFETKKAGTECTGNQRLFLGGVVKIREASRPKLTETKITIVIIGYPFTKLQEK